jgi:hypothetical protein
MRTAVSVLCDRYHLIWCTIATFIVVKLPLPPAWAGSPSPLNRALSICYEVLDQHTAVAHVSPAPCGDHAPCHCAGGGQWLGVASRPHDPPISPAGRVQAMQMAIHLHQITADVGDPITRIM